VQAIALLAILVGAGVAIYAALLCLSMPQLIGSLTRRLGATAPAVS
jgi:hypothetical protein